MKIAISTAAPSVDAEIDPRFGRCEYFLLVDPDTMEFEAIENTSMAASGGAGISAAQMIAKKGAQLVLTGNCGPNAHQTLSAAGIPVITGVSGKVKAAIEAYKSGQYQSSAEPNVNAHFGTGGDIGNEFMRGMGTGRGMSPGRGMGMGRGMGAGRGMGMRGGMTQSTGQPIGSVSEEQEMQMLRAESKMMAQQLTEIQRRIEELEKKHK
jgi:predicted Fe-Mo cluster-binding NifX family protein